MAESLIRRVGFVIYETFARWNRNDGLLLAASMAYYAALSFFPLLLVLISVLGFALRYNPELSNSVQERILWILAHNAGPEMAASVRTVLSEVSVNASVGGPLGLLTLIFGAIGIFAQLDAAFGRIWHDGSERAHGIWPVIREVLGNRLKAFLILLALGLLLIALFFSNMALAVVHQRAMESELGAWGWRKLQWPLTISINTLVFACLYKTLPRPSVFWLHALGGGVFVAVVWELGRQVLAYAIVQSNYGAYGVVGAFMAMMVWVYYASILLFLGAQMVQVLGHLREGKLDDPAAAA